MNNMIGSGGPEGHQYRKHEVNYVGHIILPFKSGLLHRFISLTESLANWRSGSTTATTCSILSQPSIVVDHVTDKQYHNHIVYSEEVIDSVSS